MGFSISKFVASLYFFIERTASKNYNMCIKQHLSINNIVYGSKFYFHNSIFKLFEYFFIKYKYYINFNLPNITEQH